MIEKIQSFPFSPLLKPTPIREHQWPKGTIPLVSIICTSYNHEGYIAQAMKGFLMQETTFPVEVLVHDDASTDNTPDIIRDYQGVHPDIIKPIYQTHNQFSQGIRPNLKYNFPRALGKYIASCEGDDYWTCPDKLQRQVEYLENHPKSVACFSNSIVIDSQGNIIREERVPDKYQRKLKQFDIVSGFCPPTNTMVFRRSSLGELPRISRKVINGDFIISAKLTEHGTIEYLPGSMAAYRIHDGGIWSSRPLEYHLLNNLRTRSALLDIYKEKYRDIFLPDIETYYLKLISNYVDQGKVFSFIYITLSKCVFNHKQRLGNSMDDLVAFFKRLKRALRNWAFKI